MQENSAAPQVMWKGRSGSITVFLDRVINWQDDLQCETLPAKLADDVDPACRVATEPLDILSTGLWRDLSPDFSTQTNQMCS